MQQCLPVLVHEELERAANAKRSQAEELQKEAETRAQEAQEARVTTQQQYLQSKAQLQSQRNEAKHLTERCSQLSYEKAQAEKRADGEKVSKEQAQQSLLAKQAEFEVVQETESNRTLREDCAALRAKSMEALTLSEEAQRLAEAARKQRLAAEEEVSMSKKAARLAEDTWTWPPMFLNTCAEKEKEAEQALEEKRKAASRLIAQDAEAQSLSRACAALKGDVAAGRRREEALEQRAKQAEAEMRRLVAEMATEPDRLEAELDALVDAQSPDKPPDMTDAPPAMAARSEDEAPAKKPRIDQGSQPSKRIRCKSKDPGHLASRLTGVE
eukprot:g2859.t1